MKASSPRLTSPPPGAPPPASGGGVVSQCCHAAAWMNRFICFHLAFDHEFPRNMSSSSPFAEGEDLVHYLQTFITIPKLVRQKILMLLHKGHNGISKTITTAKLHYFWLGIRSDISTMINKCKDCQRIRPCLPSDHQIHTMAKYPMESMVVDLFEDNNSHYLLMVDRYSGYSWIQWLHLWIQRLHVLSSEKVVETLKQWFLQFGFPRSIRSDGRPQFRTYFRKFCEE